MGKRGPAPKRNEQRQRRNKDAILQEVEITSAPASQPPTDQSWHPAARRIWDAMGNSGQTKFYEATDWAYAQFMCDLITDYMTAGKGNGQMVSSILSGLSSLMLTEGDRRRAGVELQRVDTNAQNTIVEDMTSWADRLHSM